MQAEKNKQEKQTVLVVDDTPDNLMLMRGLLKDDYKVKLADNGEEALEIASSEKPPDLILLDIMMPGMDGYEVCRRLKAQARTRDIPIIFLTAKSETIDEQMGFELGAADYITKPISPPIVASRVKTQLQLKAAADFLKDKNQYLENAVAERTREVMEKTREVAALQDVTILAMASLAETRDNETGNHIRRTQRYVALLAEKLRQQPGFAKVLTDSVIEMLVKSAPLHDIGKVGVPDAILLKPGRLTEEEFAIMKTHTTLGRGAIENAEAQLGEQVGFLNFAKETALFHHEKWDGSGYPFGIAQEEIPLAARLMALADVYDALISARIYKPAMSHAKAVEIITEGRGTHFDPVVVDAFLELHEQFWAIAEQHADKKEHS
jgi:putative two-component system response regulator